jgi:Mg2+ and Co2+ transporter CorA
MSDQSNIAELERRITAALGRIGAGLDKWEAAPKAVDVPPAPLPGNDTSSNATAQLAVSMDMIAELEAEVAKLKTALAAEKNTVAQMAERAKSVQTREHVAQGAGQVDAKVEKMTQQLDVQGLELQRMRKSSVQLRENLRVLQEAATKNMVEPQLINKAMMAELENLRATRHTETAEMDEILAELKPLISEARNNG